MNVRLVALIAGAVLELLSGQAAHAYSAKVSGVYYLKIRGAPSFDANEIGVLRADDIVKVLGDAGLWVTVELPNGKTGYVSRKYLTAVGPESEPATAPEAKPTAPAPPTAAASPDTARHGASTVTGRPSGKPSASPTIKKEAGPASQTEISSGEQAGTDRASDTPSPRLAIAATALDKPTVARKRSSDGCTKTDLDAVTRRLDNLAAAQGRLADSVQEVVRSRAAARQHRTRGPSLATRQVAFWLGVGCIVGWVAAGSFRRRRQRNRIRI